MVKDQVVNKYSFGFTAGLTSDVGNVVISFEHDSREIVYMADRWWSQRNFVDGKDANSATSYFDTLNAEGFTLVICSHMQVWIWLKISMIVLANLTF